MSNVNNGQTLTRLGQILAVDTDYPIEGTLLYAVVDHKYVSASVFKPRKDDVLYRWPMAALTDALLDLWASEPPGKRWEEIAYLIKDGRFDVSYTYPDEIDPAEEPMDRRARVVGRYFGAKPIVYPGMPTAADKLRFRL